MDRTRVWLHCCLCLIQAHGPNSSALYLEFVKEITDALRKVKTNEATILSGDFNAHVGNDAGVWKDVIGRHGDADVNDNGTFLLQLCCNNTLCIMSTFCQHIDVRKYTWCRGLLGQRSLIDFYIFSYCSNQCWAFVSEKVQTVDQSPPSYLQITFGKRTKYQVWLNVNEKQVLSNKVGQRCNKDLCIGLQSIVLASRTPGMRSGCRGRVAAVPSSAARVCGRKRLGVANNG